MANFISKSFAAQSFNIPPPTLTEKNLPDQTGRVVIITGGYAGVGQELSRILYGKNAIVYVAGRSAEKAAISISATKKLFPSSKGRIEFLLLDLADLSKIKNSAKAFLEKESRLDVLVNNAGVMFPPKGLKDTQGHELQMGSMVLGHFLFTKYLVPILKRTAASSPPNSVRITWAGSLGIQVFSAPNGVVFDLNGDAKVFNDQRTNYAQAKSGNLFLASEFGQRLAGDGIVSVCFNPGNLKTELQRHGSTMSKLMSNWLLYPAIFGAYTELYSGWSQDLTVEMSGMYIAPWGRDGNSLLRKDVRDGLKSVRDGGTGAAQDLWSWCEKETAMFV
ncbi:hypothetical protein B7494_g8195 [Chlorociboria aeruginascens]|nr:hypothetical protein B7494_g8195 [Chlorociboria aeruginascens]